MGADDPRLRVAYAFVSGPCRWVTFEDPGNPCKVQAHPACICRQRAIRLLERLDAVDPLRGGGKDG